MITILCLGNRKEPGSEFVSCLERVGKKQTAKELPARQDPGKGCLAEEVYWNDANAGARKCWKAVSVAMHEHPLKSGRTESQEGRRKKQSGHLCSGGGAERWDAL